MKNLITAAGCIMILLAFLLQFTQTQIVHTRILSVDQAVDTFRERVKQEGRVSEENRQWLVRELDSILKSGSGKIEVDGTKEPVYRGEKVHFKISVSINRIISNGDFWNISEDRNGFIYTIDRYTTSEYIGRE